MPLSSESRFFSTLVASRRLLSYLYRFCIVPFGHHRSGKKFGSLERGTTRGLVFGVRCRISKRG